LGINKTTVRLLLALLLIIISHLPGLHLLTSIEKPMTFTSQSQSNFNRYQIKLHSYSEPSLNNLKSTLATDKGLEKHNTSLGEGKINQTKVESSNQKHITNLESYYKDILKKIEKNKYYPIKERKKRRTGSVTITFSINKMGELLELSIHEASNWANLNEAALKAVSKSAPFPKFPVGLNKKKLTMTSKIIFDIN